MPKNPKNPTPKTAAPGRSKPKQKDADKPPTGIRGIASVATLKELRKATQHTQDDLADAMGMGQGAISRIEKRDDMLVSTLQHYVESVGGTFRILVTFPDRPPLIVDRLGKKAAASPKAATSPKVSDKKSAGANGRAHA